MKLRIIFRNCFNESSGRLFLFLAETKTINQFKINLVYIYLLLYAIFQVSAAITYSSERWHYGVMCKNKNTFAIKNSWPLYCFLCILFCTVIIFMFGDIFFSFFKNHPPAVNEIEMLKKIPFAFLCFFFVSAQNDTCKDIFVAFKNTYPDCCKLRLSNTIL